MHTTIDTKSGNTLHCSYLTESKNPTIHKQVRRQRADNWRTLFVVLIKLQTPSESNKIVIFFIKMIKSVALKIWIAAVADATGRTTQQIKKDHVWKTVMSLSQLEKAWDRTTSGLQAAGWIFDDSWSLGQVAAANKIEDQSKILAAKTTWKANTGILMATMAKAAKSKWRKTP